MTQQAEYIASQLNQDPTFLIDFILQNNPEAVMQNLNTSGYPVDNFQNLAPAIQAVIKKQGIAGLQNVLNVPVRADRLNNDETLAISSLQRNLRSENAEGGGDGSGAGWTFAAALIGALGNVATTYLYTQSDAQPGNEPGNSPYYPTPPAENNNTLIIVVVILVVVAIGSFLIFRKK